MDFNDIKIRLDRVYESIKDISDNDLENYLNIDTKIDGDNFSTTITFDKGSTELDTQNKIFYVFEHLAKLKDHLKNKLNSRGENGSKIENDINNSLPLQLVIDLSNQEKHGYPLTKTNRSKLDPNIKNIAQAMVLSAGKSGPASFVFDPLTGVGQTIGDVRSAIVADVVDGSGNKIYDLDKLIDDSILEWEAIIQRYGLNK